MCPGYQGLIDAWLAMVKQKKSSTFKNSKSQDIFTLTRSNTWIWMQTIVLRNNFSVVGIRARWLVCPVHRLLRKWVNVNVMSMCVEGALGPSFKSRQIPIGPVLYQGSWQVDRQRGANVPPSGKLSPCHKLIKLLWGWREEDGWGVYTQKQVWHTLQADSWKVVDARGRRGWPEQMASEQKKKSARLCDSLTLAWLCV